MQRSIPFALYALPLILTNAAVGHAQDTGAKRSINLVEPIGRGRIVVSFDGAWQLKEFYLKGNADTFTGDQWWVEPITKKSTVKDDGIVAQIEVVNPTSGLDVAYSLLPGIDLTASPLTRPEDCREIDLNASQLKPSSRRTPAGVAEADSSNVFHPRGRGPERRLFGFQFADPLCARIKIVKPSYQPPGDDVTMSAALDAFDFEPDYSPTSADYSNLGNLLYRYMKSYASAAVYYQRALDTLPADAPLQTRRVLVDQLSMSYGISGQLKLSRDVNEAAIAADPDYPLYYYNLACDDAEQGKADDAKLYLQQAFDRRANTLPGEHLPDPTTDDSILKLKKNKEFWAYVQSLK